MTTRNILKTATTRQLAGLVARVRRQGMDRRIAGSRRAFAAVPTCRAIAILPVALLAMVDPRPRLPDPSSVVAVPARIASTASGLGGAVRDGLAALIGGQAAAAPDALRWSSAALLRAGMVSLAALLVLGLLLFLATLPARRLARQVADLRDATMSAASRTLPETLGRLRNAPGLDENGMAQLVAQLADPVRVTGQDDVGDVARAFNAVYRETARRGAEEAALRTRVVSVFLDLARRSQGMVEYLIGELDDLERGEEDPDRLTQLFRLDQLATRMRRHDENILVLAGVEPHPPRQEDALLSDILRTAQSEIESYQRISFGTVDQDLTVAAHAVNDIVRLFAELFDNATRFSPPNSEVSVDAERIGDYVLVQVEDRGIGMPPQQMEAFNSRRTTVEPLDVAVFRKMGMAVVARLAQRHQIRVELRPNPDGGTIASVSLPAPILRLGRQPRELSARPALSLPADRSGGASSAGRTALGALPSDRPSGTASGERRAGGPAFGRDAGPGAGGLAMEAAHLPAPTGPGGRAVPAGQVTGGEDDMADLPMPITPGLVSRDVAGGREHLPPRWSSGPDDQPDGMRTAREGGTPGRFGSGGDRPSASGSTGFGSSAAGPGGFGSGGFGSGTARSGPTGSGSGGARSDDDQAGFARSPGYPDREPAPRTPQQRWPVDQDRDPTPGPAASSWPSGAALGTVDTPTVAALPPITPTAGTARGGWGQPAGSSTRSGDPSTGAPAGTAAANPRSSWSDLLPGGDDPGLSTWRTAADEGWRAASAAAEPDIAGTTDSGLPKRTPLAQLVPGGVEQEAQPAPPRRAPEEVRGLLTAYHRGVQRGRSGGDPFGGSSGGDMDGTSP